MTKLKRPYASLRDTTLEKLYDAISTLFVLESELSAHTVQELTVISADLSLERTARLRQRLREVVGT